MNVATLVSRMRVEILDDNIEPYLWGNDEIVNVLNDTFNELAEENLIISDQSTTAITEVKLLSNINLHAVSDYIVTARFGRLKTDQYDLIKTTEDWLDGNITDWRNQTGSHPMYFAPYASNGYLSIAPKYDDEGEYLGASDISFVAGTKTIVQPTGDFSALAVGDEINVSGTVSNNGYYTVATAGTPSFTVTAALVTEGSTNAVIRKVRDTLVLSVNRIPLTAFTESDITSASAITDIKSLHHAKLFNGMAKRLYMKPDSETYDKGKAEYHRNLFELDKKKIRRTSILFKKPDKAFTIRSGSGIGN